MVAFGEHPATRVLRGLYLGLVVNCRAGTWGLRILLDSEERPRIYWGERHRVHSMATVPGLVAGESVEIRVKPGVWLVTRPLSRGGQEGE